MIFPAPESSYETLPGLFRISCNSTSSGLAAVYLEVPDPKAVILYCHGNAEDLGSLYLVFQQYKEMGYSILAVPSGVVSAEVVRATVAKNNSDKKNFRKTG